MSSSISNLKWMKEALNLGKLALNLKEVPVGCVIVYNDQIIGRGHNLSTTKKNATRHAEFEAIDNAINWCLENKLEKENIFPNSQLYVTCEPCIMCASALKLINLTKWYYGCSNDRFGGCGSVLDFTSDPYQTIECASGVCEDTAINLLQNFYTMENPNAPQPISKSNRKIKVKPVDFESI